MCGNASEWVRVCAGVCGRVRECEGEVSAGVCGELGSARGCAGVCGSVRECARVLKVYKVVQEGAGFYY